MEIQALYDKLCLFALNAMRHVIRFQMLVSVLLLTCQAVVAVPQVQVGSSLDPNKKVTQFVHESWTEDNGLPQSTVSGIVRTPDGYLWVSTQEGLARYNGIEFQVFDKSNTSAFAQDHKIETLFVDSKGRLWIGLDNGLVVYSDGTFTDMSDWSDDPMKTVKAIAEDYNGKIWIGMALKGLFVLDEFKRQFEPSEFRLATNENLNALLPDPDGSMWIGTNSGLVHLRNKLVKRYTTGDGLPTNAVKALYEDRQGTIWVGTEAGIVNVRLERIHPAADEELSSIDTQIFLEDANGSMWIGTNGDGLFRRTSTGIESFSTTQGLTHQSVTSLMEDQEGSLWIGTDGGGLNRLRAGKFTTFTEHEGLSDNMVWTVYEDHQGGIWVGTEEGGVTYVSGSGELVKTYTTEDGLSDNLISGISGEADGTMWLGTYGAGVDRLRNGIIENFTTEDGLANDAVSGIYRDLSGRIWIGTNGGISLFENGTFNNTTIDDGLVSNFVTVMRQDLDDAMWIGTYDKGLNRITDEGIETYTMDDGLSHNKIFALHVDTENTVWIGTYGGGLTRFRDGEFRTFSMQDGLFNDYIYQILESDDGFLWMSCNKGIFRIKKDELNAYMAGNEIAVKSEVFDRLDGLKGNEMNGGFQPAGWKGADGRMRFPSIAGVVMLDPMDLPRNEVVPIVQIESFVVDGVSLAPTEFHNVETGANKIEFRFASLSYAAPARILYQYRLTGYDEDWETTSENSATYTNLDPKNYTFEVKATNNDGVWNLEGASVSFSLEPQFYETWWFIVLCIVTGILAISIYYRYRVSLLRKRHEELEEERDKARAANEFKSAILDNLSHEFRTPLTGILGYADILMAESDGEEVEFAGYIKTNGNRLLHTLDSLLELARVQRVDMELEIEEVNLVDLVNEMVLFSKPAAKERGLSLETIVRNAPPMLSLDPQGVQYALRTLLDNAVKFTDNGRIRVIIGIEKNDAVIRVSDTGIGIRRADFDLIFQPFKQASEGLDRNFEGAGVGLTVARHLVESMHGRLELESSGVEGSIFSIRFPLTKPDTDDHLANRFQTRRHAADRLSRSLSETAATRAAESETNWTKSDD